MTCLRLFACVEVAHGWLIVPQIVRQSRLYESAPAYVTDQPRFVNGALAALTLLPPLDLLDILKSVEVWLLSEPTL